MFNQCSHRKDIFMSFRIDGYSILGEIGAGGMATVYHAVQESLDRPVALKVIHSHLCRDESFRARFFNEARLMARLAHPNIVQAYDFTDSGAVLVMVMEYVEGRGLDRMIGQEVGPIPWEKALPLFSQVLSGVGYAHSRGVVHRDIKPANILVSKEGEVKITDFGIAKIAGQKGMTRTGAQMGTLYYESPEQIKGARDVDHRADIYALGMTLYEMLAGRLPFDDGGDTSEYAIMDSIVKREEHLDPRVYYHHIPEWLVGVVQKSTELEAGSRYESCDSFLRALEHGGNLNTGEHAYWSGRVAWVSSVRPIVSEAPPIAPSASSPGEACPKCGFPVEKEMEFCAKCGADLQKRCPGCYKNIRWHQEFCPKCGVNITEKLSEIEAEKGRKRKAEEKRKAEQKAEEESNRQEKERSAREREEALALRKEKAEARRLRRNQWRKRHGWKVALATLVVFSSLGCLLYLDSNSYAYRQAEKLYESGNHVAAASAFTELGNYRDSHRRVLESMFQIEGDVIIDHLTNLEWRIGPDLGTNWDAANTWAEALGDGWRMPTREELQGLWDAGISRDSWGPFENRGWWVWSGEVQDPSLAWTFTFNSGSGAWRSKSNSTDLRGFAVRL